MVFFFWMFSRQPKKLKWNSSECHQDQDQKRISGRKLFSSEDGANPSFSDWCQLVFHHLGQAIDGGLPGGIVRVGEGEQRTKLRVLTKFKLVEERKSGQLEGKGGENALEGRRERQRERKRR